ncbi:DUF4124 domain-containing protein [Geothermobacter hydrogeniphilus]|uniref:DUF4124 domain-containing protein n=1 Tax=Geothermobacter hydrogeniphilus TaxID=1969733 RepID=A0A1X0YAA3_9BACT|nr:DUF4124 domain-containing protein [Geothermobacter hydrogeniphilus]ORJ62160.1 hypothetical protein B5V00_05275 [Geothermobacter hydrogeniphilus]
MLRLIIILVVSLTVAAPVCAVELYPCRDQEGRLFVTDDPGHLPEGCTLLGAPPGKGSFSIVTSPDDSPPARGVMTAPSRTGQLERARTRIWQHRAETLLADYRRIVGEMSRIRRSRDRRVARQRLELVKEKKELLLAEVQRSNRLILRQELAELLAVIPD